MKDEYTPVAEEVRDAWVQERAGSGRERKRSRALNEACAESSASSPRSKPPHGTSAPGRLATWLRR